MILGRVICPGSKLGTVRTLGQSTLASELGVEGADEDDLYAAMDWLLERQDADRGSSRAPVTSPMGRWCSMTCPRVTSRDGRVRWRSWGTRVTASAGCRRSSTACCATSDGRPVAVEVFTGELHDDKTLPAQVTKLKDRFGLSRIVVVADRGMVTKANIELLVPGRRGGLDHRAESPDDQETRPIRRVPAIAV